MSSRRIRAMAKLIEDIDSKVGLNCECKGFKYFCAYCEVRILIREYKKEFYPTGKNI